MWLCSDVPDPGIGFIRSFRRKYQYYPKELQFTLFIGRVKLNEEPPQENVAVT